MSETTTKLVESFYAALLTRDLAAMYDVLDPTVQFQHPAAVPWGGNDQGFAGARRFQHALLQSVDARFDVSEIVASADAHNIVVSGRLRGHAQATGKALDVTFIHTWTVSGGRLSALHEHLDLAILLRALDVREQAAASTLWSTMHPSLSAPAGMVQAALAVRPDAHTINAEGSSRQPALAGHLASGTRTESAPSSTDEFDVYLSFRQAFGAALWQN